MKKIKKWDTVQVLSTKHKGKIWTIESVQGDYVLVQWVNVVKKWVKWEGFVEKTMPIHVSNVMYYDKDKQIRSRIKIVQDKSGKKQRQVSKTWEILKD